MWRCDRRRARCMSQPERGHLSEKACAADEQSQTERPRVLHAYAPANTRACTPTEFCALQVTAEAGLARVRRPRGRERAQR